MTHDRDNDIPSNLDSARSAGQPMGTQKPNWAYWANLAEVDVLHAVYLSLDIDPRSTREIHDAPNRLPGVKTRLEIAMSNIRARKLRSSATEADRDYGKDHGSAVELAEFRAWGESLPAPFSFPLEFPTVAKLGPAGFASSEVAHANAAKPKVIRSDREQNLLRVIAGLWALSDLPSAHNTTADKLSALFDSWGWESPTKSAIADTMLKHAAALPGAVIRKSD